jgi:hypothetical protein
VLRLTLVERADEQVGALVDGIADEAVNTLRRAGREETARLGAVGSEADLLGEGNDALGEGIGDGGVDEDVVARLTDLTSVSG